MEELLISLPSLKKITEMLIMMDQMVLPLLIIKLLVKMVLPVFLMLPHKQKDLEKKC